MAIKPAPIGWVGRLAPVVAMPRAAPSTTNTTQAAAQRGAGPPRQGARAPYCNAEQHFADQGKEHATQGRMLIAVGKGIVATSSTPPR